MTKLELGATYRSKNDRTVKIIYKLQLSDGWIGIDEKEQLLIYSDSGVCLNSWNRYHDDLIIKV